MDTLEQKMNNIERSRGHTYIIGNVSLLANSSLLDSLLATLTEFLGITDVKKEVVFVKFAGKTRSGKSRLRFAVLESLHVMISNAVRDRSQKLHTQSAKTDKEFRVYIDVEKSFSELRNKRIAELVSGTLSLAMPQLGKIMVSNRDSKLKITDKWLTVHEVLDQYADKFNDGLSTYEQFAAKSDDIQEEVNKRRNLDENNRKRKNKEGDGGQTNVKLTKHSD